MKRPNTILRATVAGSALAAASLGALVFIGLGTIAERRTDAPIAPVPAQTQPPPPQADSADTQRFLAFLGTLRTEAESQGLKPATLDAALAGLLPDPEVMAKIDRQPEFVISAGDYLARVVTDARIETGRLQLSARALPMLAVESTYGVDRHVLAAIWAIESNYGSALGERNVIRSLATLAAGDPRRGGFWRQELLAALAILERGETTPDRMVGSWAGAMGHTQFMPSTYTRHAADFDGDGRRDIWGNPLDALASAANYLKVSGWRADRPWGVEVALPQGFDLAANDPLQKRSWQAWSELGVRPAQANARVTIAANEPAHLLLPAGIDGPAFLVTRNFEAVLRYNNATSYALAVGHLADRLAGGDPLVRGFPASDQPLSLADRTELQTRLAGLGHDTGAIDGMIGSRTRSAIRAFQIGRGLPADGYASQRLLEELRRPLPP